MKKSTFLAGLLAFLFSLPLLSQHASTDRMMKHETVAETGISHVIMPFAGEYEQAQSGSFFPVKDVNINWQFTDGASVGSKVQVSAESGQTLVAWWLNDERISLYENTSAPVWQNFIDTDWEWPIDLTENGTWAATGYDSVAQVFNTASSSIFWETIVDGSLMGVKLNPDGSKLFIARNYAGNVYVEGFTVGGSSPDWSSMFTGNGTVFTGSDDGSTLVLCQYTGVNKMWVIDAATGDQLFDAFYKNQNPPALSYDGHIILNGDYSGNVYVYAFDEATSSYSQSWTYKVGGGGTSVWVAGMGVSGDGSTLAVGTLVFLSGGGYDGEIYLFNSWSPVPLWIFQNAGDEVASIDFTYDGSLVAAAGWGPLDHSKPDFWLFRKESSTSIYSINTLGSFNAVDISDDGTLCSVTGKAVHSREFGSGGLLYNIDSHPDGGILSGTVDLENANDHKNVKITINELNDYYGYSHADGTYEIQYIPADTYTVTASKIGYYPVTVEDVQITEGEITTLDIILEETGNPPEGLFATQGAGLTVGLTWGMENAQDITGFNIYRKHIQGDLFPEEPLATVSNLVYSFEDEDLIPLREYYYAVTAILEEGVESPYSNVATGWMSDGFVTGDISAYVGTTPTVDGTISPGEWDDAFMLDGSDFLGRYDNMPNPVGSVMMYFKMNAALTELYVACINANDTVLEDHDEVALYVDDNNDGSYPLPDDLSEGNYWAAYYASGNVIRYRPIYNNGGVGDIILLEDPLIEVSDATGVIVYEFMIPVGADDPWQINPNSNDQSGLFSFTLDDPTAFDGYWPCWNPEIFIPLEYGVITFGATDDVPPAPEGTGIWWIEDELVSVILSWDQPAINDFDHFNIYHADGGGNWELLESTIGRQFIHGTTASYQEYYVTTVDHAGQESEASETMIYDITIQVGEQKDLAATSLYPNPCSGPVTVSMAIQQGGPYSLKLLNTQGETVGMLYEGHLDAGLQKLTFNPATTGSELPPGMYFIQLQGAHVTTLNKLVILGH